MKEVTEHHRFLKLLEVIRPLILSFLLIGEMTLSTEASELVTLINSGERVNQRQLARDERQIPWSYDQHLDVPIQKRPYYATVSLVRGQDALYVPFTDAQVSEGEPPGHIRDNAFLVEEAFNQEPGDVQHIFNWINLWDKLSDGEARDFLFSYTMELPLGSQTHQFSFTTQSLHAFEKLDNVPATQEGGVGDTFLNYRYQLLADDEFLWCAPRFSLVVPTGDERFGLGTGQLGYQFNLPISSYGDLFDYHFNAGATYIPNVSLSTAAGPLSPRHDLNAYNLGASVFYKPETYFNVFVEALALWNQEVDPRGFRDNSTQVFVNPGLRYAVCQLDQVEWVVGLSLPIGLTPDTPEIGLFAYMSVEHNFLKLP